MNTHIRTIWNSTPWFYLFGRTGYRWKTEVLRPSLSNWDWELLEMLDGYINCIQWCLTTDKKKKKTLNSSDVPVNLWPLLYWPKPFWMATHASSPWQPDSWKDKSTTLSCQWLSSPLIHKEPTQSKGQLTLPFTSPLHQPFALIFV